MLTLCSSHPVGILNMLRLFQLFVLLALKIPGGWDQLCINTNTKIHTFRLWSKTLFLITFFIQPTVYQVRLRKQTPRLLLLLPHLLLYWLLILYRQRVTARQQWSWVPRLASVLQRKRPQVWEFKIWTTEQEFFFFDLIWKCDNLNES